MIADNVKYDLLTLKDAPTELGTLELNEGKITQIRLILAEGVNQTVTVDGQEHVMDVPSGKVKIVGNIDIVAGEETPIALDFDAAESVKEAGGGYMLRPTVKLLK